MAEDDLTVARLRELFHYDPETGKFTVVARRRGSRKQPGDPIGKLNRKGYVYICVGKKTHKAHRLAWLYQTGAWPDGDIDHKNLVKSDNRFDNLRPVDNAMNQQNRARARADNRVGVLGVSFNRGRYAAHIEVNGVRHYLGRFDTADLAGAAYIAAKRRLHPGCTI
jgi:hypothetical protein